MRYRIHQIKNNRLKYDAVWNEWYQIYVFYQIERQGDLIVILNKSMIAVCFVFTVDLLNISKGLKTVESKSILTPFNFHKFAWIYWFCSFWCKRWRDFMDKKIENFYYKNNIKYE